MQAGEEYARRAEAKELARVTAEAKAAAASATDDKESKKDQ